MADPLPDTVLDTNMGGDEEGTWSHKDANCINP